MTGLSLSGVEEAIAANRYAPGCPFPSCSWRSMLHCYSGVAVLYLVDKLLEQACSLAGVTFPSALIGLFLIVACLLALSKHSQAAADGVSWFFKPGVEFVAHRYLPIWYISALVTLPLAVQPLSGVVLVKAVVVVCLGVLLMLAATGQIAVWIRRATGTEMAEGHYHHTPITFSRWHYMAWGCIALSSLLGVAYLPHHLGPFMSFPFLLSTTLLGYMAGMALPQRAQRIVHPVIVCGAAPNLGAALLGAINGEGYWAMLRQYRTKGEGGVYGPGDFLLSFLGVIILSFGFKVFEQWAVMRHHAPEILGATSASAALSMFSTAALARLLLLPADVSRALIPRSVTMALALPISAQLDAPQPITAAAVVLTGIVGANFVQSLLNFLGFMDPIARGLAAAATAHGLGTAALAGQEPEALPYCALSYAMCGIMATLLASLPFVRTLLEGIAGC